MTLKATPLNSVHRASGAKMVDFGGWDMPVNYGSQIEEHNAVRTDAGMFDVSHMCVVDLKGANVRGLDTVFGHHRYRFEYTMHHVAVDVTGQREPRLFLLFCLIFAHSRLSSVTKSWVKCNKSRFFPYGDALQ